MPFLWYWLSGGLYLRQLLIISFRSSRNARNTSFGLPSLR